MIGSHRQRRLIGGMTAGLVLLACLGTTGCQVQVGGQTLPSPYYLTDDVQYYAPGPEFKLANEAAAMKAHSQEMAPSTQPVQPAPAQVQPVPAQVQPIKP